MSSRNDVFDNAITKIKKVIRWLYNKFEVSSKLIIKFWAFDLNINGISRKSMIDITSKYLLFLINNIEEIIMHK